MKYNKVSRRQFLTGAAGSFLALPFLPSLMSKAKASTLPNPKFFVMFWSGHGGINLQNMYPIVSNPAVSNQLTTTTLYSAKSHTYRSGNLSSLLTTRASNLSFLSTNLDGNVKSEAGSAPDPAAYSTNLSGADFDNGAARVSASIGSFMSPAMLNKMNLIAGIDLMYGCGHTLAATGNFMNHANNSVTGPDGLSNGGNGNMTNYWMPTLDWVMAKYPGFYASQPAVPSAYLNNYYDTITGSSIESAEDLPRLSAYGFGSASTPNPYAYSSVGAAFAGLFSGLVSSQQTGNNAAVTKRNFILNKIHDDYLRVSRGAYGPGRRIGQEDRNIFEQFMANISSLLTAVTTVGACVIPSASASDHRSAETTAVNGGPATTLATQNAVYALYNQIITAAFSCGVTQCFSFAVPDLVDSFWPHSSVSPPATFTETFSTDTHQGIFHSHNLAARQQMMMNGNRNFFQYGFYNLMQQLDSVANPSGGTLLDASLLYSSSESGFNTHQPFTFPVVTAGGAGGTINTGKFLDYRNTSIAVMGAYNGQASTPHIGVPYNRFMATMLQAMGVPPSGYEVAASKFASTVGGRIPVTSSGTVPGYGHPFNQLYYLADNNTRVYPYDYQLNDMSVPLPGFYKA